MIPLPNRIWIAGACGSGKSTLATKLAPLLGVEPTHLDEIHWRPGWVEGPAEVTDRRIRELTAQFDGRPQVRLRSQREVDRWLRAVGATEGA